MNPEICFKLYTIYCQAVSLMTATEPIKRVTITLAETHFLITSAEKWIYVVKVAS